MADGAKTPISVIGLGYVGLPVATAFAAAGYPVVAFDIDPDRVAELVAGHDRTRSVPSEALAAPSLHITADPDALRAARVHIIAVPTPVDAARQPDLGPFLGAARVVAPRLTPGAIVVFESTVFPGATEECAVPVLEAGSGLRFGQDFAVGYSPERINPGDPVRRFETIAKVVSASSPEALDELARLYGSVITAPIHRAATIRVAEAAKVIENTQRDLNIALMNELAMLFSRLGLDTRDVLAAARTKWNFLPFEPGLVGGHCIGVDPYYLTHKALAEGFSPAVILAGRSTNEAVAPFIATRVIQACFKAGLGPAPRITVLGVTYKADVNDVRNSKVVDLVTELEAFGARVSVHDPLADPKAVHHAMGLTLTELDALPPADAVILAVGHADYLAGGGWPLIRRLLRTGPAVVADIPAALGRADCPEEVILWRL
ncbi:nucleotide sugar dehydrogenase [Segnochrobactraceae bacterium EtOH-i3]